MRFITSMVVPLNGHRAGKGIFPGVHQLRRTRRRNPWGLVRKISGRRDTALWGAAQRHAKQPIGMPAGRAKRPIQSEMKPTFSLEFL